MADYYKVLGLEYDDPPERIKARYRLLARRTHPDSAETNQTDEFTLYTQAYRVLSNPARRQRYNEQLGIFVRPRTLRPGHHLYQRLLLTSGCAEQGGVFPLTFTRYEPCARCWLTGCDRCQQQGMIPAQICVEVNIPPHTQHGACVFVEGQGGQSEPNGTRGDLFVYIMVG
ncbi:MAG: DnaJ domain-containing protein [Anaerolineae bacterium]|nr:DnaJ domain-containing protein [Anaerolineae bacterium]